MFKRDTIKQRISAINRKHSHVLWAK